MKSLLTKTADGKFIIQPVYEGHEIISLIIVSKSLRQMIVEPPFAYIYSQVRYIVTDRIRFVDMAIKDAYQMIEALREVDPTLRVEITR